MQASSGNILNYTLLNTTYSVSLRFLASLRTLKYVFHKTMTYEINNDGQRINTKNDLQMILVK